MPRGHCRGAPSRRASERPGGTPDARGTGAVQLAVRRGEPKCSRTEGSQHGKLRGFLTPFLVATKSLPEPHPVFNPEGNGQARLAHLPLPHHNRVLLLTFALTVAESSRSGQQTSQGGGGSKRAALCSGCSKPRPSPHPSPCPPPGPLVPAARHANGYLVAFQVVEPRGTATGPTHGPRSTLCCSV